MGDINILDRISTKLNEIIKYIVVVIFSIFLIISLIIKPMYNFNDFPYFSRVDFFDYLMIIMFIFGAILLNKHMDYLNEKLSKRVIAGIYFFLALGFVLMVPLKTFSDMKHVLDGAIAFSNFDFDYLRNNIYFRTYPNNIFISIFYGIFFMILPKKIIVIKIINIIMSLLIAKVSCDIFKLYYQKYNNIVFLMSLSLISVFIYSNHIYTDVPFTLLSVLAIYLYLKRFGNIWIASIILIISYFIRPLGLIYLIAIFIDLTFQKKNNYKEKVKYGVIALFSSLLIFILISNMIIPYFVQKDVTKQIPASSYVYMAFNKEKFGFQDGSHSPNRSFSEVIQRLDGYSLEEILEIVCKKTYWMWMEGTYQAQRYGFGEDRGGDAYLDKYEYNTKLLKFFANSQNKARMILNSVMYAQYIVIFALMILGMITTNNKKSSLINMIFVGFFIFYIFWEIKSRYIFSLYPFMIMYAVVGLINLHKFKLCIVKKVRKN